MKPRRDTCLCWGSAGLLLVLASFPAACDSSSSVGAVRRTGGVGAGGSLAGVGGTMARDGGLGTGGYGGGVTVITVVDGGGVGAGGTGTVPMGTGGSGAGPEIDAGLPDVPMTLDSGGDGAGTGGTSGGGRGGTGGATGTGGSGVGGTTSTAAGGTGGTACMRGTNQDDTCRAQNLPPRAYFCRVPAVPPSTACVIYNAIDSGDYVCCPDEYASCPDRPPTDGGACAAPNFCTYGSHPDPACRTRASCTNGSWRVPTIPARCSESLLPAACPASPSHGTACSSDQLSCYYPTGEFCACTNCPMEFPSCSLNDPTEWYCWTPPAGDCPTYYPNIGSVCDSPADTRCRYTCDSIAACSAEGTWISGGSSCPECNAPDTPIATPEGDRPIASLVPGDLVYSVHRGRLDIVPIAEVGRRAQHNHHVVRVQLATGTVLEISPRHPTADGRTFGDLVASDQLDGIRIVSATLVPYRHSHTYDILPASDTGTYYAGGARIGSTMFPEHRGRSARYPVCELGRASPTRHSPL